MNKIYKVIFNRNKNRYEIVSELASSRGGKCKVKAGKQIAKLFMTGLLATFLSSVALAADQEVKVKYDETTGTIKIVKTDPNTSDETILASYAVGGNISPITSIGTKNPTGIIAMGDQSKAVQSNTIAIGADAHAGNVGGSDDTNGRIAIGTKTVASGNRSIALGNQSATNNGSYNIAQGNDAISIGTSTSVFGYSGVSIGRRNIIGIPDPKLVSKDGVLTTKNSTSYKEADPGGNSVIVGAYNVAYGNRSNVIGTYSRAMGSNSVAIGSGVQSLSDGAIAIGKGSGYEFEDGSRHKSRKEKEYYGRDWELPPEYKVLKQVLSNDITGDEQYNKETGIKWENGGTLPKYNNYGAGSSDPGGFIVEGKNALGIGTYTQVRGDSAIGLATGEMTADLSLKDKSEYAKAMSQIMGMEEALYEAKEKLEKLKAETGDTAKAESAMKAAEEKLAAAKKAFRETYLKKYSFVDGNGALGVGRQILAQGDRSMAVGDYAKAISSDAIAYGGQTLANGTNSMAMGGNAHVGTEATETTKAKAFDNSMAIGSHTNVQADNAVALGAFTKVEGDNSLALGFGKQSGDDINYNAVSGKNSTLIGSYGTVKGNNSILIGSSGSIANDRVVALGNNINIAEAKSDDQDDNTAGSVFLGDHAGYVQDSKRSRTLGEVDVVGSTEKMNLTESLSSTKGALRDYTKDFIYIYMLERQDDGTQIGAPIAVRSDFAGGDSTVGVVSVGSTYEQTFENLDKIKEHHKKVGSLITVPVEDVTVQVSKNGISLGEQKQTRYFAADSTEEAINADRTLSEADKKKVWNAIKAKTSSSDSTYTVFETRRIQNVAPGLIGVNSTDAINGSQLFATNQMLGNLVGSLKKTFGDNVTITPDGQIGPKDKDTPFTLGWIAKAGSVEGSNGTVAYKVDKAEGETDEANQEKVDKLQSTGYVVDAAKTMTFKAGKNIGLVQKPGELSISTVDTPSFTSVELRGETKDVDGKNVTEVTKIDSSGMKVVTETSTPASDGSTTPTVTEKVSTTVGKDGVSTDGNIKVTNGTTDLVTIDKGTDNTGTDQEYGKIGLDGKNGSNATITVDRGTKSLNDDVNIGVDPSQPVSKTNESATMDRITYTTTGPNNTVIDHEVATMDDGLFFSGDSADGKEYNGTTNTKNTFGRKLSEEAKIVGGVTAPANLTDNNIGVVSNGSDTLTIKLAKQLTGLDSATYTSPTTKADDGDATSTMKVDGNGIRFVGDNNAVKTDAPSLTTDGIDGGNKQITNVGSGLKDGNTDISISDLKDPNKVPPTSPVLNNAVNVGDLKNIIDTGFKLNTSGQATKPGASTVKIGDTINIIDGANTKVSAIDDTVNGTHTFHIDVNGLPMSYVDNQGKPLTKIGDTFYRTEELVDGKPPAGAKGVPDTEVTSNVTMLDKNGKNVEAPQIKNIGSGLVNGNNKAMSPSDLLNTADNNPVLKNAVNAGDLKQVAAAVKTEVTGTGKAIVTNTTAQDGHTIYNVHVDPVVNVVAADGKTQVVRGDDGKYYDPADIENKTFVPDGKGGGNWYNTSDIGDNGQPNTGASVQNINPVDVKNNFVNPNGTGSIVVDNVKSGIGGEVKDPAHNNKNTFIDNVNKVGKTTPDGTATQDAISENTVVNAKDLKNLVDTGFKLNTSGQPADPGATTVKIGETIKVVDGTNTKVSAITTSKDGVHAFHIDVTGMPISYTDTDGNALTKIGDNYYKNTDITNGVPNKDAVAVDPEKVTDNIKVINKDGSTTNPGTISNVKSAIDGVVGNGAPNGSTINGEGGTNTFIDNINKVGKPANEGGIDKTTVVNAGDLKNLADTPLFFSGDSADGVVAADGTDKNTFSRKLSQETKIVGGVDLGLQADATAEQRKAAIADKLTDNNIGVVSNGTDTLTIKLAKNLVNLTSVETGSGNNKTKMTENGVTTTVKDGDTFKVTTTTPNGLATTEVKLDSNNMPTGESKTTTVTTDGVTITTQTPPDPDRNKPASTTETKLSKDGLATDGTIKVTGDAKDLVTIGKGTETDPKATDKEFGTVAIDGKNGSNAILTVDRGTKSVTDKANILKDPKQPAGDNNPVSMDRLTYTTTGADGKSIINHEVATLDDGFFLTTSTDVAKGKAAAGVKLNHTIKFTDGANTKVSTVDSKDGIHELHVDVTGLPMTYTVSQTGGTDAPVSVSKVGDTYQLADGTKLVKVGDKFYKPSQLVNPKAGQPEVKPDEVAKDWSVNDSVSLVNKDGSTNAPTLKNVGSGLKDANGNSTTLDQAVGSNAVNVDDLRTMGKAATTEVTGTGAAEVTKVTGADGQNIYNVHVDKLMTVKPVDPKANITRGGDGKYYNKDDIAGKTFVSDGNGGGSWYNASDVDAKTGKPLEGKSALAKQPIALDQSKLKNSVVNPNGDGATIVDNVKSGIGGEAGNGIQNGTTIDGTTGNNTFIKNLDKVGGTGEGAIDKTTVVNAGDLKNLADTPLFFSGDSADGVAAADGTDKNTFARKLSQETKIVGGVDLGLQADATAEQRKAAIADKLTDGNIGVISDGTDTLTVKLAKNLVNLTSVETGSGDNKTKMTENGVTTTVKDGDTFKVTTTTPNGLATTEVKLDSEGMPKGESTTTMVTTDGVTITTQTPKNGDKPASTTETKLSKDGLATDGTVKVTNGKTGDNAKDLVTIGKGTETDPNATDKEFGTVAIDGKNGSNATLTVDRGTKSVTDSANVGKDPTKPIDEDNPVAGMDRLTYTTTGPNNETINHEVATLDDGFMLTTSTDVANSKAPANVKLNNTIKFTDGANTKVSTVTSKDGVHELHVDVTGLPVTYTATKTDAQGNVVGDPVNVSKVGDTYQDAAGNKLIKVGDKYYRPDQLMDPNVPNPEVKDAEKANGLTITDSISLVNNNGTTNPTTLKNVGSGLKDANGNATTLDKAVGSNAVNVDDLRTMGKAATTEVTGTGAAEVTKTTGADGQNIYNVHVDKLMTVKPVDANSTIARGGDGKYYNAGDIAGKTFVSDGQGGGSWYDANDVDQATGKPKTEDDGITPKQPLTDQPQAVDQNMLKNSVVNPNGDGATIVDNVKSGIGGKVKDTSGKNTFIDNINKVGKPASEGGIDKTTVVNAGDLKNLADTPLFFQGDVSSATGTNNTFSRKLSEKVSIVGEVKHGLADTASAEDKANAIRAKLSDGNIGVVSNGTDTLTIKLAKDLTDLHSVTTTDDKGNTTQINGKGLATTADGKITTVTSDGITIVTTDKDGNSVSLTNKGLDNGHHQIINVKSGLLDRQGKPVTLKKASGDILNNAVNVKDLRDVVHGLTDSGKGGGFGLTGNNGEVRKSLGETITLKGGIANKIENGIDMNKPEKATTDKNTYIDVKTSENGSEKIMVVEIAKDLTDLNSAEFTDQEGNTTKMKGDGIYIDKNGDGNADISLTSEGLNNGGNKITNVADGTEDTDAVNVSQLNKLKQEIKQNIGDEINELNAYAPVVYLDKDGNRVIRKGNKFVKKNDETAEIPPQDIRLSLVNADGKTTNPSTLQNVAKGVQDTDAVNVKQLKEATEKPLTFNGDAGSSSAKLGETVAIKGGANSADLTDNNIGVIANSSTKTLNVKLSKKLKGLESAEFVDNNGNTTNITGDGVHISGGNGSNVSLTSQGLNNGGNRITNVAPGVEATDAVNVSQLTQVGAALHNRINNVAKGAYGGVASAGAMASLPQAYLPGKSMVAAGASHYRGESAVALGASRISDNGKIILKLNASHNTSGNTMVGAGVGYQF